jgi:hypothetical protein
MASGTSPRFVQRAKDKILLNWCPTSKSGVSKQQTSKEAGAMLKPFSRYLKAVEEYLPSEHHPLLRNSLYLAILDWYTDGVDPREAAARISNAVAG